MPDIMPGNGVIEEGRQPGPAPMDLDCYEERWTIYKHRWYGFMSRIKQDSVGEH